MREQPSRKTGFTLIELMVAMGIAAVVMSIAVPSFISAVRSNRLTGTTNSLVSALNLARSEAVKRGQIVVVRRINNDWANGWQVFVDIDRLAPATDANTYQAGANSTLCEPLIEDCLLREFSSLPDSYTLEGDNNFTNFISFKPSGELNMGSGNFVICDNSDGDNLPDANESRLIVVNPIGRVSIAEDTNVPADGIPNTTAPGNPNIASCLSPF